MLDAPTVLTDDTRDLIEAGGRDIGSFEAPERSRRHRVRRARQPAQPASERDTVRLVVDTSQLQFFDVDTGLAIRDEEIRSGGIVQATGGSGAEGVQPALEEVR